MHWGYYGQYGRIVVNVFPSKLRRLLGPSGKGKVFCLRAWMDFCFPPMFPSSLHLITPKEGHCSYALNKTASVIPPLLFSFVYWWHSLIMYNLPQGENSLSATKWQFTVYVLSYACTLKHPRFIVLKQTMMTSCSLLTPKVTWRFFPPPHLLVRCRVWEEIHCCELYDKMLHPPLTFSDWDIRRGLQVK